MRTGMPIQDADRSTPRAVTRYFGGALCSFSVGVSLTLGLMFSACATNGAAAGNDAILAAAQAGAVERLRSLVERHPELVSARTRNLETALHLAAWAGHADAVEVLLGHGAGVNARAYNQFTPLHLAKDPKVVRVLLDNGADVTLRDSARVNTALQEAAFRVSLGVPDASDWQVKVRALLSAGSFYDILSAIYLGDTKRVSELLDADPGLASRSDSVWGSPLRVAARAGRAEICKALIAKGTDVDQVEGGVGIPVVCEAMKHPEVVRVLLLSGADVKTRITSHRDGPPNSYAGDAATALHYAAEAGSVESAQLLVDYGLDVNACDANGRTPLHVAAMAGSDDMIRFLLKHGADETKKDTDGRTPRDISRRIGRPFPAEASRD